MGQQHSRSEIETKALKRTRNLPHIKMSKIFSWEYLSFVTLDDTIAYKEALVIPALIFVLSVVWMQLVKDKTTEESEKEETKRDINFEQAYLDAKANEVDSGTELDSQGEEEAEEVKEEEIEAAKNDEEKKDD